MKKILSIILTLCMLAGLVPVSMVTAEEADLTDAAIELAEVDEEQEEAEETELPEVTLASSTTVSPKFKASAGLEKLQFTVTGLPSGGWAALYPEEKTTYVSGEYADWISYKTTDSTITFPSGQPSRYFHWPLAEGKWKVVIFADGGYTNIAATASFDVVAPSTIAVANEEIVAGDDITFNFTNSVSDKDWIAVYSSNAADPAKYLAYKYTVGEAGSVTFSASEYGFPNTPGDYTVTYYHDDGYLPLESTSFTVGVPVNTKDYSDITEIYVSATGSDANDGTVDAPVKTVARAIELMGTDRDYKVYIMGATYSFEDVAHTGKITYEAYEGATLAGGTIKIDGPSVFNINTAKAVAFYSNGHYLEIDGDITTSIKNTVHIGTLAATPEKVVLKGQYFDAVYSNIPGQQGGDVDVIVDGAEVFNLRPAASALLNGVKATVGNFRVTVNSGVVFCMNGLESNTNASSDGYISIVFNNNTHTQKYNWNNSTYTGPQLWFLDKVKFAGGEYIYYNADTNGNMLTPVGKGVFEVSGTKTLYSQAADKKSATYVYDGKITLPTARKVAVKWVDSFSTSLLANAPDGDMPFVGWNDDGKGNITAKYLENYHVSATGNDSNKGTPEAPLLTITEVLKRLGTTKDATVYVVGAKYPYVNTTAHTGTITLEPYDATASMSGTVKLLGPTKVHVNAGATMTYRLNGYDFELDGTFNRSINTDIFVGNTEGRHNKVTLKGQYVRYLTCFNDNDDGTSETDITIDGAYLYMICPTSETKGAPSKMGNLRINVLSGHFEFFNEKEASADPTTNSYFVVTCNNNSYYHNFKWNGGNYTKPEDWGTGKVWFKGGEMLWLSADTDGNYIVPKSITEFEVVGEKTAYYQTSDKKTVYYSVDGKITLPNLGVHTSKGTKLTQANLLWTDKAIEEAVTLPEGASGWRVAEDGKLVADFTPEDIYVSASGSDVLGVGIGTKEAPLKTIAEAINRKGADKDFTIYVMGAKYSFGTDIAHTGTITILPADDTATLAGGTIKLNGPTKIGVNNNGAINYYPNGYYFELNGTVINRSIKSNVHVGNTEGRDDYVVLKGQYIDNVYNGVPGQQGGNSTVIIDGAHLYQVRPTPATNAVEPYVTMANFKVIVNSGEFQFINTSNDTYSGFNQATDSYFVYVFNNNTFNVTPFVFGGKTYTSVQDFGTSKTWYKGGEMGWKSADTDGNYIIPKTITEYEVVGNKTAYYQTSDKKTVYYSVDGKITLPNLGVHTAASSKYTQANILWAEEFTTDILATPAAQDGKNFVCWQDLGNGKLVARYAPMPKNFEYYVKAGGTGDGTSVDSPAPSLTAIVKKINDDGHDATTGKEVTVYIIDSDEPRAVGTVVKRADMAGFVTLNQTHNHTAKINFTTYDYENTKTPAVIYNTTDITPYTGKFHVMGNESYKNLIYIDTRTDYRMGIYAQGYDLELENFTYRRLNISARASTDLDGNGKIEYADHKILHNQQTESTIAAESTADILMYTNRAGSGKLGSAGNRVIFDKNTNIAKVYFGGYFDSTAGNTVPGDQTLELRDADNKTVIFAECGSGKTYTYNGDVNLVLDASTGITFNTTSPAVISGAVQVILNNGSTFTPNFMSKTTHKTLSKVPYYVMTSDATGKLDVTADAGVYKVNANGLIAYAFKEGGNQVYYGADVLTVAEDGEYTVKYVATKDAILNALDGVFTSNPETGMLFKGWEDDGNGTLTAVLEQKVPETKAYYVRYAGTGDGRSADAPAGSVSDVVKSVNDDLIFGDTAIVYIMNNGDPLKDNVGKKSTKDTLVEGTFTYWAKSGGKLSENHYATLYVTSYDANPDDGVAPAHTYLAYSSRIGANDHMAICGPTIFDNITIVRPRHVDREIYLAGYDVTFTDSARIAQADADFYSSVSFTGINYLKSHIALGYGSKMENDQVVRINAPITAAGNNHGISFSSSENADFNGNVTVYINNAATSSQVSFSKGGLTSNFNDGLNIIVDAASSLWLPSGNYATGVVTVKGGLQVINNNGTAFPAIPANVTYDDLWVMNSAANAGGRLDVTETAGTFKVPEGKYAFVQSSDNKTITYGTGTITLPAGEYTVKYADDKAGIEAAATKPADIDVYNVFDKWVDDGNGKMTATYKYVIDRYYVSATGSDANDGRSEATAFATTAKAIEVIEASKLNGLVFIMGNVEYTASAHTQTVYFESLSGGKLYGADNTITLAGPTSIKADFAAAQTINANGYVLILDGTIDTAQQNIVCAGNKLGIDSDITIAGKYVHKLYTHEKGQNTGDANVVIDGGILAQLITGSDDEMDGSYVVNSVKITLNNGEFWSYTHMDNSAHKAAGTFEFVANGGKYYFDGERTVDGKTITEWYDDSPNGVDGFVKIQYDAGKYVVRSADKENNLVLTETAGTYAYEGEKTPYYVSETGLNIYYGIAGKIKLTTGAVDVSWVDEFVADKMPSPKLPAGFEFLGWLDDGNGTLTANVVNPNFFYVDETAGNDSNNGAEATPFKTIAKAIAALEGKSGYVYVVNSATYDVTTAFKGLVTIEGTNDASTIKFAGNVALAGNIKLEDVKVELADNTVIATNGNRFEISENVTVSDVAIATGTVSGADRVVLQNVNGTVTVGASEGTTVVVKDSTLALELGETDASTAIKVTADNTTITGINAEGKEFASLEVISNGKLIDAEVAISDNTWYISSEAADAVVDQTDVAGVYGVKAPYGKLPVAVGEDGKIYVADSYTSEDIAPETWYERNEFSEYINYRKPLNNTYKKLTEDKELTVCYFGGSMTAGAGASNGNKYSWRGLVSQWLVDNFPDAKVTNINRACGESGSYLGTFRLQTDIIARKPDLMFLEYSINDKYYQSSYESAGLQVETILRELKQVLPETDIVFVLVTDQSQLGTNKQGKLHIQAQAHEDMATLYGYSTLHVGRRLAAYINYNSGLWSTYATDGVHLKDSGYRIYYDVIEEFMYNSLFCTDFEGLRERNEELLPVQSAHLMDGNRTHYQPTEELLKRSEELGGTGVTRSSGLSYTDVSDSMGQFILNSNDDVFVFEFDGTDAALWTNYENKNGMGFLVAIDGGDYVSVPPSSHNPARIVQNLSSGKHTIKVKKSSGSDTALTIRSIFTIDYTKSTLKGTEHTYTDFANYTFTLPAGKYEVMYLDGGALSADALEAPVVDNKLFLGWFDENDEVVVAGDVLAKGDVVSAKFCDFVATDSVEESNFVVEGVQIRLKGEPAFRFVNKFDKTLLDTIAGITENFVPTESSQTGVGYGFVVLPTDLLDGPLTKETEKAAIVPAVNTFKTDDDAIRYTVCITNVKSYTRDFTAVPYITYTDASGVEHTVYGEEYSANMAETAAMALEGEENLTAEQIASLKLVAGITE